MTNTYNLFAFKLSISIYNKLADDLLLEFREALSNEITFNERVKALEKNSGIKLNLAEFNEQFREENPELVKSQHDKLNNGYIFSVIAALVCELTLKYLILKNDSNFPNIHNLKILYDKLDITQKDSIKRTTMNKCRFISEIDFDSQLEQSSNNFVKLRYFFEGNEHELNDIFLKGFKDSLIELIEK